MPTLKTFAYVQLEVGVHHDGEATLGQADGHRGHAGQWVLSCLWTNVNSVVRCSAWELTWPITRVTLYRKGEQHWGDDWRVWASSWWNDHRISWRSFSKKNIFSSIIKLEIPTLGAGRLLQRARDTETMYFQVKIFTSPKNTNSNTNTFNKYCPS